MGDLPKTFTSSGLLPPGDYRLTLAELRESMFVSGGHVTCEPTWDASWREHLVNNFTVLTHQLWQVGIEEIFVDGSFAEDKHHPNDIDGYFVCEPQQLFSGELERELNLLDPHKVWTWDPDSRRPYRGYAKKQLPMWHTYRVELYPHVGQISGIRDAHGNELLFPSAFRQSRGTSEPKGIVRILKEENNLGERT